MHEAPLIPEDLETCQRKLREAFAVQIELTQTVENLDQQQEALQREVQTLELAIKSLLQQLYGRRSERWRESPGQQHLEFSEEGVELDDPSVLSAAKEEPPVQEFTVHRKGRTRKPGSESLPDFFERRTQRIEPTPPEGIQLEDCTLLGVDVVELLEIERGQLWVRRLEYPKYKLPSTAPVPAPAADELAAGAPLDDVTVDVESNAPLTEGTPSVSSGPAPATSTDGNDSPRMLVPAGYILQAPRLVTLIPGGRFGFSVAAEVLFNKFGLHLPLYRQQDALAQLGWSPNRSSLGLIVSNSADLLIPLWDLLRERLLADYVASSDNRLLLANVIGTDDTPVTLLTPGEDDGSREARFWLYRGRAQAPYDVFAFTNDRTRAGPDQFLKVYRGILCGDCYSGYVNIETVTGGRIVFSACLSHARRYIFKAREQEPVLISAMLAQFRQLYDIEDRARTMTDAERLELRKQESAPVMARLRTLLDDPLAVRALPKTNLGKGLAYLRNNWDAFQVFLTDGGVPIDNNDVERDLRRIAIGRKNWLFVGSQSGGERAAIIFTIIASAHRHDLDVPAYLRDALETLAVARAAANGDPSRIDRAILDSLLPDVWVKSHPKSVRTFRTDEKQKRAEVRRIKRAQRRQQRTATS